MKTSWKTLVLTDILFKLVTFILLTPSLSLLFRFFLSFSGKDVLTDMDIASFLVHPIGLCALVIVGGAWLAILAIEQSALMTVSLATQHQMEISGITALRLTFQKSKGVLQIAWLIVYRLLLLAIPFLAIGGAIFWVLLTEHDINFYLSHKPPRFWLAAGLIGTLLIILLFLLIKIITGWAIAFQLHLFEDIPPGQCLSTSKERLQISRKSIMKWIVLWFLANSVLTSVLIGLVILLGQWIVPASFEAMWQLVLNVGLVLLLFNLVNFGTNLVAVISLAVLLSYVYDRSDRGEQFQLSEKTSDSGLLWLKLTRGRVISALLVAVLISALIGVSAIQTINLEDDVEITAHRGASGRAPENSLAAVRAAIEDQADWVEVDVQETRDGVVVVAHDADLMKVARNNIKIWEASADELRSIDIGSYVSPEFKDERVPTLEEVLLTCKGKIRLNIELKYYGHDQNLEQRVVDLVEKHQMADAVIIMSLDIRGIQKIKQLRPEWTVGLLSAVALGDLSRSEADFLAVSTRLANRSLIQAAHSADKEIFVWTVNDEITLSTMISRGVDNLITDHPALARQVLAERAEMSPLERFMVELAFLLGAVPENSPEE